MFYTMIVEQLGNEEYRNKYDSILNTFIKTEFKSLLYLRNFVGVYGWIDGFGIPPDKHLDILMPTKKEFKLGDCIKIKIIGCFKRNDEDNKFVGIEENRIENTFSDLFEEEKENIKGIYPKLNFGEKWLERDAAIELLKIV